MTEQGRIEADLDVVSLLLMVIWNAGSTQRFVRSKQNPMHNLRWSLGFEVQATSCVFNGLQFGYNARHFKDSLSIMISRFRGRSFVLAPKKLESIHETKVSALFCCFNVPTAPVTKHGAPPQYGGY